ncbi:uncharacterized protein LOC130612556 [Hydractinia symbiolongicarpus]|uniref:uncharacterized protein LOC130612556 n=1 Tax=Hydractinia symbiolongicarpus TaxID=13093 RepID=UPI00254DBB74|nr:uncharacterized protein LOC130612556 [Hydractinia symbiolongicarpus]
MSRMAMLNNTSLSVRVKRRLFHDDDEDKTPSSKLLDEAVEKSIEDNIKLEIDASTEQIQDVKVQRVLVITPFQDGDDIQQLSAQATIVNMNVLYCLPENSFRQCDQTAYKIIFTDVDLSQSNEMLRIIVSIKKTSAYNKTTPVIAIRQTHHSSANDLSYYGVAHVHRGTLNQETIKEFFATFGDTREKKTEATSELTTSDSMHPINCNANVISHTEDVKTFETILSAEDVVSTNTRTQSTDCMSPVYLSKEYNTRNNIKVQRPVLPKSTFNMPYVHPTQVRPSVMRRYAFVPPNTLTYPYMVSDTPGSSGMKITLVPDDITKHSTKERMRRERIKECCEHLRMLLPRTGNKRIDMATVLELSVLYIKVLLSHTPANILQQSVEAFQSHFRLFSEKKRLNESCQHEQNKKNSKKLRSNDKRTNSTFSKTDFNSSSQNLGSTNSGNNPLVQSFPNYRYQDHLGNTTGSYARAPQSHYQAMEYLNMATAKNCENLTTLYQGHISHQSRASFQKDVCNEAALPVEFTHQHTSYYNHYSQ